MKNDRIVASDWWPIAFVGLKQILKDVATGEAPFDDFESIEWMKKVDGHSIHSWHGTAMSGDKGVPTHYRIWTKKAAPIAFKHPSTLPEYKDAPEVPQKRTFASGATRDTDEGKLDYEGFLCPSTLKLFAEYMHTHRKMADGSLRDSDNWQKGMPMNELIKSGTRHFQDWRLHHRGFEDQTTENMKDTLCGILFNVFAYLKQVNDGKEI